MPLLRRWEKDGGLWGIWHVTETEEGLMALLADKSLFADRLASIKVPKRRLEILGVCVLLKDLLGEEKRILHEDSGKPFLEGDPRRITISHTKGYVAVGIHGEAVPGMDIEQVGEKVRRVASRFIRADEMPGREQMTGEESLFQLLLHWSAKETLYKLLGCLDVDFRTHLRIRPFKLSPEGEFVGEEFCSAAGTSCLIHYFVHPDFVCTYCVRSADRR